MGAGEARSPWLEAVEEVKRRLQERGLRYEALVVFGSWARGGGGEWSDVDLLVVSDDAPADPLERARLAVELRPPRTDLFILSAAELERMVERGNPLALSALAEGVMVEASERVRGLAERARRMYVRRGRFWYRRGAGP